MNQTAGIRQKLEATFGETLGLTTQELREANTFDAMGVNSLCAVRLLEAINSEFDLALPTSVLFECHDIESLEGYVRAALATRASSEPVHQQKARAPERAMRPQSAEVRPPDLKGAASSGDPRWSDLIAIVGLSCRCAGAANQREFWNLVSEGRDCISKIDRPHWIEFFKSHLPEKDVPAWGGVMSDADKFDPLFFRISPAEAEAMEPAQRIALEECYAALEDAAYDPHSMSTKQVAVILGSMGGQYAANASHYSLTGTETSILSARLAYFLNLKGPAMTINTACSSSLVAIDLACTKLKCHEIDVALAGGVSIYSNPLSYVMMQNAGMLSASGRCRPFDNSADGIVVGDGVGIVVLKRLADAVRDTDQIYAVIEGIGINQDGRTSGLTVPSFSAQSELQQRIYRRCGVNPEDIEYLETHGTGTRLGDPIEIHAISDAFAKSTDKKQFCAVGALKANIGHTTAAAGVLGLIKAVLAIKNKVLPPAGYCKQESEHIDFQNSPFYVNKVRKAWESAKTRPRRAAVSSFGFSGTNAHAVLREYVPESDDLSGAKLMESEWVVPLSARTEAQLTRVMETLLAFLKLEDANVRTNVVPEASEVLDELGADNAALHLSRLSYTLQVGRAAMEYRIAFVVQSLSDLVMKLDSVLAGKKDQQDVFRGCGVSNSIAGRIFDKDGDFGELQRAWIVQGKQRQLADYWTWGGSVDWALPDGSNRWRRLSLPTYPFEKSTCRPNGTVSPTTTAAEGERRLGEMQRRITDGALAESSQEEQLDRDLLELSRRIDGNELLELLRSTSGTSGGTPPFPEHR